MRFCKSCESHKDEQDFNRKGNGYQSQCRLCQRSWYKKYYDEVPKERERLLLKNKEAKNKIREKIKKIKEETPCTDCGKHFPYFVMDFDHQRNKEFTISTNIYKKSWSDIEKEIEKCELVCANCHRIRTHSPLV